MAPQRWPLPPPFPFSSLPSFSSPISSSMAGGGGVGDKPPGDGMAREVAPVEARVAGSGARSRTTVHRRRAHPWVVWRASDGPGLGFGGATGGLQGHGVDFPLAEGSRRSRAARAWGEARAGALSHCHGAGIARGHGRWLELGDKPDTLALHVNDRERREATVVVWWASLVAR